MLRSDNPSSFFFVELDNFGANCLMSVGDLVEGFKISGEIGIIDGFHPISNKGVHPVATVFVDVIGHEGFRDVLRRVFGGCWNEFTVFFIGIKAYYSVVSIFILVEHESLCWRGV